MNLMEEIFAIIKCLIKYTEYDILVFITLYNQTAVDRSCEWWWRTAIHSSVPEI